MRRISSEGTKFIAKAILLLDNLYIKTPKEWKGILLPLHPVFLWRYYEIFKTLITKKKILSDEDKDILTNVLSQLPQVLTFIVANDLITGSNGDRILPYSGNIEMLPTFENKTNRYLGNDGVDSVEEILTRWVGFAPYTKNEIRICTVDAPDLIGVIRQIKQFMDSNSVKRVVCDIYLTRNQNGNVEFSKLDYSGKDYEIEEFLRKGRLEISIHNVTSASEVKQSLKARPVHVAFYFDQSSYTIEFGPNDRNLYINPLVITYDYAFDEIQHKGSIYPSSEMDSGLIGDYHKIMKSVDIINNNKIPRVMSYDSNADMTSVVSTISDQEAQWLVVADRETNNYQPQHVIPVGEKKYDKRMVNVWASTDSRIIDQYLTLLRSYNLYPQKETLIEILCQFGHIASSGLISIPKFGADSQSADSKRKGLIGTLFAAYWYKKLHNDALVASLDDDSARLWLQNSKLGSERADLLGLYFDENEKILHIEPIEVKTRDEAPDAVINRNDSDFKMGTITGHAADQIATMVNILKDIFSEDETSIDMFTSARREVLKYQIVTECFRNVHDADWQQKWYLLLKKAFKNGNNKEIRIKISGILLHIKLNEHSEEEHVICMNSGMDDCQIEYWKLTSKQIQNDILGAGNKSKVVTMPDLNIPKQNIDAGTNDDNSGDDTGGEVKITPSVNQKQDNKEQGLIISESLNAPEEKEKTFETDIASKPLGDVSKEEINRLVMDFRRSCGDYHVKLRECNAEDSVVGPSVIRLKFTLARGQSLQGLSNHLDDIGREMKRTGVIIQSVPNSDVLLLDVPRLHREKVLFKDIINSLPKVTSPEQLYFPIGRTPNGKDLFEDLGQMPHMLVGGSTGSGKSVFLFAMLAAMLMTHPRKEDLQLILSSSKLEDFIYFEGLPHLYSGGIISEAEEATRVIKGAVFEEFNRRGKILADARVPNITEYNKESVQKMCPMVIVIDEFADLVDQLGSKTEANEFYQPVQRIAQAGRSRGIHLVICTQRPEAKLVPSTTKAQLNGRVALRVNDGTSSRMIIDEPDAKDLQKHGDMIYRNGDVIERAQGYLIEIPELEQIIQKVISGEYAPKW